MTFKEVLEALLAGKKITYSNRCLGDGNYLELGEDGYLYFKNGVHVIELSTCKDAFEIIEPPKKKKKLYRALLRVPSGKTDYRQTGSLFEDEGLAKQIYGEFFIKLIEPAIEVEV